MTLKKVKASREFLLTLKLTYLGLMQIYRKGYSAKRRQKLTVKLYPWPCATNTKAIVQKQYKK
jgi:hypothetical protein